MNQYSNFKRNNVNIKVVFKVLPIRHRQELMLG